MEELTKLQQNMNSFNIDNFVKRYIIHPILFIFIIENDVFIKDVPVSNIFDGPDLLLLFLYRMKSACTFTILMDVFGGSESTCSDLFNKMVTFMADFLKGTIPPFENIDFLNEIKLLDNAGAPNPKACLIADCQV